MFLRPLLLASPLLAAACTPPGEGDGLVWLEGSAWGEDVLLEGEDGALQAVPLPRWMDRESPPALWLDGRVVDAEPAHEGEVVLVSVGGDGWVDQHRVELGVDLDADCVAMVWEGGGRALQELVELDWQGERLEGPAAMEDVVVCGVDLVMRLADEEEAPPGVVSVHALDVDEVAELRSAAWAEREAAAARAREEVAARRAAWRERRQLVSGQLAASAHERGKSPETEPAPTESVPQPVEALRLLPFDERLAPFVGLWIEDPSQFAWDSERCLFVDPFGGWSTCGHPSLASVRGTVSYAAGGLVLSSDRGFTQTAQVRGDDTIELADGRRLYRADPKRAEQAERDREQAAKDADRLRWGR